MEALKPEHFCAMAGLEPDEFVEDMKKKGIRVPGIGHRIKSKVGFFLNSCVIKSQWLQ